jgi:molybdenum cofactor biosynthesis protein A
LKSVVAQYQDNHSSSKKKQLIDPNGRKLDYLRLSLTERCNLRCNYCMPPEGVPLKTKENILSFEEMERLISLFLDLGVKKIRITGGEPFVRKGAHQFIKKINDYEQLQSLNITTNAVLIKDYLADLKELKLKSLNISLDTLNRETFKRITLKDDFEIVYQNIFKSLNLDIPTKINVVVLAGINEHELPDFAELIKDHALQVRFIEPMPFNGGQFSQEQITSDKILKILKKDLELEEQPPPENSTARIFKIPGYKGSLGIIEGFSRTFCASCNRLRISAEGVFKTCIYDRAALNFKQLIRDGASDPDLIEAIRNAVSKRAKDGFESQKRAKTVYNLSMAEIGG